MSTQSYQFSRDPAFLAILAINGGLAFGGNINSFGSPYIAAEFGLDDATVAAFFGWIGLGNIATLLIAAQADQHGRRRIMLVCLAIIAGLMIASAFAPDLLSYVALQIVLAALGGAVGSAATVLLTELLPDEARSRGHSRVIISGMVGAALGFMLLLTLVHSGHGWRAMWLVSGVAFLLIWLYSTRFLRDGHNFEEIERGSARELFELHYTWPLLFITVAATMALTGGMTYIYYFLTGIAGVKPFFAGFVFLGGGIAMALGTSLAAGVSDRLGRKPVAVFGLLLMTAGIPAFYLVRFDNMTLYMAWLAFAAALMFGGVGAIEIAGRLIRTELYPTNLNATFQGLLALVAAITAVVAHFANSSLTTLFDSLPVAVAVLSLMSLPAALGYLYVPESRGRYAGHDHARSQ